MLTAVVPVLVGPLQTLLALLPAILMALGSFLFALFTPRGFKRAVRFLWHQKLLTALLGLAVVSYITGYPFRYWQASGSADARSRDLSDVGNWPAFRGNASRTGVDAEGLAASGEADEPTANRRHWDSGDESTVFSSPAIVGRQVIFATAGGIGPFSPAGRGAIVSVDAMTGEELWKYAPDGFRATFSSPVVAEGRVVCGEGLHLVQDARVTCLDLGGHLIWEFTTKSHVEATPAIADGRVFVGAGGDGFYCLALHDPQEGAPRVLWHLPASEFPDCESPPVVADGVVYFGLGEGGQAICAVSVADGEVLWRIPTPHPVFAPPTLVESSTSTSQSKTEASAADRSVASRSRKLIVPMGRGNFIQSAAELLEARLEQLKADGASDADLERARQAGRPEGEVWCIDVGTQRVEWRHKLPETVLGAASCVGDELYFGARDGRVYCLGLDGKPRRSWNAREPIVASVAAGRELVYAVTVAGHLHALRRTDFEPLWEASLRASGSGDGVAAHFLSSPAVARGRVYVGSAQRGLCCLGERGPAPLEHWSRGLTGGAVDERLLPERGVFAGELPAVDEWFDVDLPTSQVRGVREQTKWAVHPLAACSTHLVTAIAEKYQTHLVGWSLVEADRRENASAAKHVWHMDMPGQLTIPPSIAGRQIVLALATPDYPDSPGRIGAVSLDTGRPDWLEPLEDIPLEVATDDQHIYVLTSRGIAAFALGPASRRVWRRLLPRAKAVNSLLANDLLFAVRDGVLQVFDTATGVMLRTDTESVPGLRLIGVDDQDVLVSMPSGIERRRIVDGARVWRCDVSVKSTPVLSKSFIAVSTTSGELAVIDLKSGAILQKLDAAVDAIPPLVTGDRIYLATPHGFDQRTAGGELQKWCELRPEQLPATPLVAARGRLYYLSQSRRLACVSGPTP